MHHVRLILLFSNFQIPPDSKKIREINSFIGNFFLLRLLFTLSGIIVNSNIFLGFFKVIFSFFNLTRIVEKIHAKKTSKD